MFRFSSLVHLVQKLASQIIYNRGYVLESLNFLFKCDNHWSESLICCKYMRLVPECAKLVHWKSTRWKHPYKFLCSYYRWQSLEGIFTWTFYILLRIELLTPNIHICWQEAMRHLKETMFPCHYPLQLPNLNPVSRIFSMLFIYIKMLIKLIQLY